MEDTESFIYVTDNQINAEVDLSSSITSSDLSSDTENVDNLSNISTSVGQTTPSLECDDKIYSPSSSPNATGNLNALYPESAYQVDLSKVQHLEEVLQSVPLDNQHHRSGRRKGPTNYAVYHSTGSKISKGGGRGKER